MLCVVVNAVDYKMPPQAAVDAPRQHHQWFPDRLTLEETPDFPGLTAKLKAMGHATSKSRQGDAHTIGIDPTTGRIARLAVRSADGDLDVIEPGRSRAVVVDDTSDTWGHRRLAYQVGGRPA